MSTVSKTLSGVAKATASRSKGRARPMAPSSSPYSTMPPSKVSDLEEEEEAEGDDLEDLLKPKTYIAFPKGFSGGGGFWLYKEKETNNFTGSSSSYGQGQGTNGQGAEKPDYGGGCTGCHGCSRCPGCNGCCRFRS